MAKLNGVATIELTNPDGSVETHVHENMITNAVSNILSSNCGGNLNVNSPGLSPLSQMFGSVLLFENTITENVATTFPPQAPMGWAGYLVNTSVFAKRGSANITETGPLSDGFKYVWDFSTSQGNGTIASLGLSHGGAGCSNQDDMLNNKDRFKVIGTKNSVWDTSVQSDITEYNNPFAIDGNFCYSIAKISPGSTSIRIYKSSTAMNSFSLSSINTKQNDIVAYPTLAVGKYYENISYVDYSLASPITIANYTADYSSAWKNYLSTHVIGNNVYLIYYSPSSRNNIRIIKIDYTGTAISDTTVNLPADIWNVRNGYSYDYITDLYLETDGEVYIRCTDNKTYAIDLETKVVRFAYNHPSDLDDAPSNKRLNIVDNMGNKSILMVNYLGELHMITTTMAGKITYNEWSNCISLIDSLVDVTAPISQIKVTDGLYYFPKNRVFMLDTYYLATINNLDTPVTKTSAQTMKITYTLRYVS